MLGEEVKRITPTLKIPLVPSPESSPERGEEAETPSRVELSAIPRGARAQVKNYVVEVVEVHKVTFPWKTQYIVTCRLHDSGKVLGPFQVYADDADDFKRKLLRDIEMYERQRAGGGV
jgi:hypothetical protein